jgi:tRNA-specific 2-thiouridylase
MIAVAVSGGVDSLVAAHILGQETPDLFAVHFLTGFEPTAARPRRPVQAIGDQLGIPVHVVDVGAEFRSLVVDYFTAAYGAGLTPNPCAVCNPAVKFGSVLRFARARIRQDAGGRYRLYKGADPGKDQSYFLARLDQAQLSRALFPLGSMTKAQVRERAADCGLHPVETAESQDVCFVPRGGCADFLQALAPASMQPGPIETVDGRFVGRHAGLSRYTIGQRRGINCPAAAPYYVVRIVPERNLLVVGDRADLLTPACRVENINWIAPTPEAPMRALVRVRYRTPEAPATLTPLDRFTTRVEFDSPQSSVTPGQAAVFYDGTEVLGGGFIASGL